MSSSQIVFSRRLRQTPYEQRAIENGAKAFTVYNHMPLSSVYQSPEEDYRHLCEHVQIWDVAAERQVEVVGPDALTLLELVTPREVGSCAIGQCLYAPLVDEHGGIVNDPIILRLDADRFWVSIADSDVLLWMKGIAFGRGYDVKVFEPDVSPLAIQGPKSDDLIEEIVGPEIRDIRFFRFIETRIVNTDVVLARSGWSGQGGFEIYLQDSSKGHELWDAIWQAGEKYSIRAGCPNLIERLETGLLSYGSDMTLANNPLECGLDRFFKLGKEAEYMSRQALDRVSQQGVKQKMVHLMIHGDPLDPPRSTYSVTDTDNTQVGIVTSLAYSPKYAKNLSFATVKIESAHPGTELQVSTPKGVRSATVKPPRWG